MSQLSLLRLINYSIAHLIQQEHIFFLAANLLCESEEGLFASGGDLWKYMWKNA